MKAISLYYVNPITMEDLNSYESILEEDHDLYTQEAREKLQAGDVAYRYDLMGGFTNLVGAYSEEDGSITVGLKPSRMQLYQSERWIPRV